MAVGVLAVLAAIAVPGYSGYRDRVNNADAEADITKIAQSIDRFYIAFNRYPNDLNEAGVGGLQDPWGHAYQYLRIDGAGLKGNGKLRKDKNLVPINTDYDLYSKGKDGNTVGPLTANQSKDDIVRANNGQFIGLAADY